MPNVLPILFIVLVALSLVFTLLWLWQSLRQAFIHTLSGPTASDVVSPERATLLAEKQSLLMALKDLDAERESGKLSNDDYRELNDQYRKRARDVLRQLDGMLSPHRDGARALIAAAAATGPSASAAPVVMPSVTAAAGCKSCGADNDHDAVFCKKCGTRLRAEATG
jgi:ribosomal protein L40E